MFEEKYQDLLKNIKVITYLIGRNSSQIVHRRYSNSCLVLGGKSLHYVFHGHCAFFLWRRLSHEAWRIWRETEHVHLREVYSCMLTRASKYNNS